MPDEPEQQTPTPQPLTTTEGRLGGIAREALVADTGTAKLAGLVREALIAGVGLAGRIGAQSAARGSVTTTTAGLVLAGRSAATSAVRGSMHLAMSMAGHIGTAARGNAYVLQGMTVAGRIATMSSAQLLRVGALNVGGAITAQSAASGLVYIQLAGLKRQWGVVINTG